MAGVKHKFTSPVADAGNPNEVGPVEWNDDHDLTNLIKAVDLDFGAGQTYYGYFTVSDADVLTTSNVQVWLSADPPAVTRDGVTADGDEAEMERMTVLAQKIRSGAFDVSAEIQDGPVTGPYRFNYIIG